MVTVAPMVISLPISTVAGVMDRLLTVKAAGRVEARIPKMLKWVVGAVTTCFTGSALEVRVAHPPVATFQTAITRFLSSTPVGT